MMIRHISPLFIISIFLRYYFAFADYYADDITPLLLIIIIISLLFISIIVSISIAISRCHILYFHYLLIFIAIIILLILLDYFFIMPLSHY